MTDKYVSLFAGAGGLDLGLMRAGFSPVLVTDESPYACATLRAAVPSGITLETDVHDLLNSETLTSAQGTLALVAGQPPLLGGNALGAQIDPDSDYPQLLYRFMDTVRQARPASFALIGIPALNGTRWRAVLSRLREDAKGLGYATFDPVLDAADYGVPQHRARLALIGMPEGCTLAPFAGRVTEKVSAGAALHAVPAGIRDIPCTASVHLALSPDVRGSAYSGMLLAGPGRVIDLTKVSPVLPSSLGGNKTPVIDVTQLEFGATPWIEGYHADLQAGKPPLRYLPRNARMRRLSLRECAALQGFPPGHPFHGPAIAQFRHAGTAVPPALGEAVGRSILAGLK